MSNPETTEVSTDFDRGMEAQRQAFIAMLKEMVATRERQIADLKLQLKRVECEIAGLKKLEGEQL